MKKFFLGLIAFGLSIISFGYCGSLDSVFIPSFQLQNGGTVSVDMDGYNGVCVSYNYSANGPGIYVVADGVEYAIPTYSSNEQSKIPCYTGNSIGIKNAYNTNRQVMLIKFKYPETTCPTCPECETCPTCFGPNVNINKIECDGGDCSYSDNQLMYTQTGTFVFINLGTGVNFDSYRVGGNGNVYYNFSSDELICPIYTGNEELSGNWSALFINGIQHESSPLINVNIADWVVWDYSISEDSFDLDVGSGYDQDYIDGVIDVQSYRPTSEDFTQTFVGGLILFTPYVVILLFVILIWKLIKGIFKTK